MFLDKRRMHAEADYSRIWVSIYEGIVRRGDTLARLQKARARLELMQRLRGRMGVRDS